MANVGKSEMLALLSPEQQVLAFLSNDSKNRVLVCNNDHDCLVEVDLAHYLARHPNSEVVSCDSREEALSQLEVARECRESLDFCLMVLDSSLSLNLKRKAASSLDQSLSKEVCCTYVLDILLSSQLPNESDVKTALQAAQSFPRTTSLLECVINSQEKVLAAVSGWKKIAEDQLIRHTGPAKALSLILYSGVWRETVLRIASFSDKKKHTGDIVFRTKSLVDPRISTLFINSYSSFLPQTKYAAQNVSSRPDHAGYDTRDAYSEDDELPVTKVIQVSRTADEKFSAALKQVTEIKRLYCSGKDELATKFRDELVNSQNEENDKSFVVKSLCNIAKSCSDIGRNDVAVDCLKLALTFPDSADFMLYTLMANLFKDLRFYDEASDSLDRARSRAKSLEEFQELKIQKARLEVARGNYDLAVEYYTSIPNYLDIPSVCTSYATVLRKMGRVSQARQIYNSIYAHTGSHHAIAGLAEINRQTGRFDKSIRKYADIFRISSESFDYLDERSRRIYRCALGSLFCLTGHLAAAEEEYNSILKSATKEVNALFGLAKVKRLQGDFDNSKWYFDRYLGLLGDTESLATRLYKTAIASSDFDDTSDDVNVTEPEYRPLESCNQLLQAIIKSDFKSCMNMPETSASVFKLHRDFHSVLHYHARKVVSPKSLNVENTDINRLRKRGLIDLRLAVSAIDKRDFETAVMHERNMCLKVA